MLGDYELLRNVVGYMSCALVMILSWKRYRWVLFADNINRRIMCCESDMSVTFNDRQKFKDCLCHTEVSYGSGGLIVGGLSVEEIRKSLRLKFINLPYL